METLAPLQGLIDKLSEFVLDLPQNKIYTTSLSEFIISAYQQVSLYEQLIVSSPENEHISVVSHSDVEEIKKSIQEACEFLVKVLENDPQFSRKQDAQNDYLFEREDREQVGTMKVRILNIQDAVTRCNTNTLNEVSRRKNLSAQKVFQFDLHSRVYNSKNGVVQPEELTNDPRTFHLIGHENSGGRSQLQKKVFHVLNNQIAQQKEQSQLQGKNAPVISAADSLARNAQQRLKVILVSGVTGVGKSNFALNLCRELCQQYPDSNQRKFHLRLRANTKYSLTVCTIQEFLQSNLYRQRKPCNPLFNHGT